VNVEVTAVEEKENEEKKEESCTECEVVELGKVSRETKGGWYGSSDDSGVSRRWP
jgi:hypothetical protein